MIVLLNGIFIPFYLFMYVFTAELGPHCCASVSLAVSRGCSPDAVHEPPLLWSTGFRVHRLH